MVITSYMKRARYVVTMSSLNPTKVNCHSKLVSGLGTPSTHSLYVSRRRAFNRASAIIYCNKDILNTFVTLTYKNQHSDYKKCVEDLKNSFSRRHISYIAVIEKHKSGNLHIHCITSDLKNIKSLRKNKYSWGSWRRGFSDVKFISSTDDKFRIEKYIFKYMMKAEKIGGRFFLKSRDLTVKRFSYAFGDIPIPVLHDWPIDFHEYNVYDGIDYKLSVERIYYEQHNSSNKRKNKINQSR